LCELHLPVKPQRSLVWNSKWRNCEMEEIVVFIALFFNETKIWL
jgi:hypothetical protein